MNNVHTTSIKDIDGMARDIQGLAISMQHILARLRRAATGDERADLHLLAASCELISDKADFIAVTTGG